jgi:hypothetical protein
MFRVDGQRRCRLDKSVRSRSGSQTGRHFAWSIWKEGADLNDLIGLIYETVADAAVWREVACCMSAELEAQSFWMFRMERTGPNFLALEGLSKSLIDAYESYFHHFDILMAEELRRPQNSSAELSASTTSSGRRLGRHPRFTMTSPFHTACIASCP